MGKLHDEGFTRISIAVGSTIYVIGIMMVSISTKYYSIFLAQGLTMGIGIGITFLPALSVLSHYWRRRRALATGIVVSGSSVGGVCFPIALNRLFGSVGFGWAVRITGFIILGCLLAANFLITTRLPGRRKMPANMQHGPLDFSESRDPIASEWNLRLTIMRLSRGHHYGRSVSGHTSRRLLHHSWNLLPLLL